MSVNLSLDARQLKQNLTTYSQLTGKSMEDVVRSEMGSLARTILRYTPPTNQKQGRDAVARDIRKLFTSPADLFPTGAKLAPLKKAIDGKQWDAAVDIILRLDKFKKLTPANSVDTSLHQRYRGKTGRVTTKSGPFVIIRDPAVLKAYVEKKQAEVGKAKASWLSAIQKYGASAVAGWITRHGSNEGAVKDTLTEGEGYVEAIAINEGAVQLDARLNLVARALANTEKALTIRLQKTLEKLAKAV